jgi:hypothetical protein
MRSVHKLRFLAMLFCGWLPWQASAADVSIKLTSDFQTGGGGCVGEIRVYEASVLLPLTRSKPPGTHPSLAAESSKKSAPNWAALNRMGAFATRYFMTSIGCSPDRLAISLDGKSYVLEEHRIEQLGMPVTYLGAEEGSPRVRVERKAVLHSIRYPETECTQLFEQVRVEIDFKESKRVVSGIATAGCP